MMMRTARLILFLISTPALAQLSGQVIPCSSYPEFLCYQNGDGHFTSGPGDPEDFLYRGTRETDGTRTGDQSTLLTKLIANGGNCLYLQVVRSHGGDGDSTHNPWIDSDEANALDQDILDQWEGWFDTADANDIVVYLFFFDDSSDVFGGGDTMPAGEQTFVDAIVNEFEHHTHLVWVVAEEYSESFSAARASAIASRIRTADDNDHPIGVHQLNGLTFDFPNDANVDAFLIQRNNRTAAELNTDMNTAWTGAAGKYNNNLSESSLWGTGSTNRLKTWASAMSGAYVMVLGMDIDTTATADLADMGRVVTFFEATDFYAMAPDNTRCATGDCDFALSNHPSSYIAYADAGTGTIGLDSMAEGTYDLYWFDPQDGDQVTQEDQSITTGTNSWSRPGTIGTEAVVWVHLDEGAPATDLSVDGGGISGGGIN